MGAACSSVVNVGGMSAIQIRPCWYAVRISVPDCSRVIGRVQPKGIRVLTQTIKVRTVRKRSTEIQILRLEYKRSARSVEEGLAISSCNGKAEWGFIVCKAKFGALSRCVSGRGWPRENGLRDLIDCLILVFNKNMKTFCWFMLVTNH